MRLVVAFVVCGLIAWPRAGAAQTPAREWSPRGAEMLLASSDPRDQAWGAWIAGRVRHKDAAPLIESVIKAALTDERHPPGRLYVALDALIELDARPDPAMLLEVFNQRPTQALILLSRLGASANASLLAILSRSKSYEWFAAANLLNQRQTPGFAALVLKDVNFVAKVVVSADGSGGVGVEGGMSAGVGDKAGGLIDGYPPIADYEFRGCYGTGLGLLASGPLDVCYARYVSEAGLWPALSSHFRSGPTVDDRLDFFRSMAPNVDLNSTESVSLAWKDDKATKEEMARLVDRIRRRHRYLLDQLVGQRWLTESEAAALSNPVIREEIVDLRKPQK
jgi:hypothetical protein